MTPRRALGIRVGIFGLFAAFFLWFAVDSALAIFQASRASAWPTVPGHITYSGVAKGCGRGASFYPVVSYTYTVAGTTYEGKRVTFGNVGCGPEGLAQTIANEWPSGKTVPVYVDPSVPTEAVITTHVHEETKVGVVLTGALFLATAAWAFLTFMQMRSNSTIERDARKNRARPSL
jgi:hypothetical protein